MKFNDLISNFRTPILFPNLPATQHKLFLDAGAHIDLANEEGFSALNILKHRQTENYSGIFPLINRVLSLKCCCANILRQNKISFEKFPPTEENFVPHHSNLYCIPDSIRFNLNDIDENVFDDGLNVNEDDYDHWFCLLNMMMNYPLFCFFASFQLINKRIHFFLNFDCCYIPIHFFLVSNEQSQSGGSLYCQRYPTNYLKVHARVVGIRNVIESKWKN